MNWSINADGNSTAGDGRRHRRRRGHGLRAGDGRQAVGRRAARSSTTSTSPRTQIDTIWNHEIYESKLAGPGDGWGPTDLVRQRQHLVLRAGLLPPVQEVDTSTPAARLGRGHQDRLRHHRQRADSAATPTGTPATASSRPGATAAAANGALPRPAGRSTTSTTRAARRSASALDWCWNGDAARAELRREDQQLLQRRRRRRTSSTATTSTAPPKSSANPSPQGQSAAFIGPAAVGAMSSATYQSFVNASYNAGQDQHAAGRRRLLRRVLDGHVAAHDDRQLPRLHPIHPRLPLTPSTPPPRVARSALLFGGGEGDGYSVGLRT